MGRSKINIRSYNGRVLGYCCPGIKCYGSIETVEAMISDDEARKLAEELRAYFSLIPPTSQFEIDAAKIAHKLIELLDRQRWISVSESPPHLINVFCYSSQGNMFTANCCKGHLWNLPTDYQDDEVTHWIPLPQPPEQQT